MTDPVRWRDDESASPEIRELLASGTPPPALEEGKRLAIASFAATLATADMAAAAGATTLWSAKLVAGIVSLVSLGALGGVAMISWQSDGPTAPSTHVRTPVRVATRASAAPRPVIEAQPVSEAPRTDEPAPHHEPATARAPNEPSEVRRIPRLAPRPTPIESPPPSADDALQVEAALLERARGALSSHPHEALELADRHARDHAAGQLAAERELIAIDALVRLDRRQEARRRADVLVRRTPRGMYARRVERMLQPERVDEP